MLCEATLEEANISVADLDGILLSGGSTRVPLVLESIKRTFQREPIAVENVDEVVALGAALYSAYKSDHSRLTAAQRTAVARIKVSEATGKCFGTISLGFNSNRNERALVNNILIAKGTKIPCSVTKPFYTLYAGQQAVECQVTESTAPETDPRFVKIIWKGDLELPPNRPDNQEIKVSFAYDENQVMKCSFIDVATGRKVEQDLSMTAAKAAEACEVDKFLVE
jgi:molecular chaperone DnaK (HSP70)